MHETEHPAHDHVMLHAGLSHAHQSVPSGERLPPTHRLHYIITGGQSLKNGLVMCLPRPLLSWLLSHACGMPRWLSRLTWPPDHIIFVALCLIR